MVLLREHSNYVFVVPSSVCHPEYRRGPEHLSSKEHDEEVAAVLSLAHNTPSFQICGLPPTGPYYFTRPLFTAES